MPCLLWCKSISSLEILWVVLFVFVVLVTAMHFQFLWKYRSLYFKVPGLPMMPIIGSILFIPTVNCIVSMDLLYALRELVRKYGPVFRAKIGRSMVVGISDPDLIKFFLKSRKYETKSPEYRYLKGWLGNGLITGDGEQWQKSRKLATPALNSSILNDHIKVFESACDVLISVLYEHASQGICDIEPIITAYTLDIISESAMGIKINSQRNFSKEYSNALHFVTSSFERRSLSIYKWNDFLYQFTSDYRKEQKCLKILNDLTLYQITERRKYLSNNANKQDYYFDKKSIYLDILLNSNVDGQPLSDEEIRVQVNNITFGGHDTTASTISFLLYELGNNLDVQNKILDEMKLIFGTDKNCHCTMQDLNDMKYTEMVIKEVLRYYAIIPTIARQLTEDANYNDIIFPKGTTLMFNFYNLHHNPTYFKDPSKFNPERFDKDITYEPYTFIPFSTGNRNCVGQKYGMLEMKLTVARLIRHFEFLPAGPAYKIELNPGIIMKTKNGLNIRLRPRS